MLHLCINVLKMTSKCAFQIQSVEIATVFQYLTSVSLSSKNAINRAPLMLKGNLLEKLHFLKLLTESKMSYNNSRQFIKNKLNNIFLDNIIILHKSESRYDIINVQILLY